MSDNRLLQLEEMFKTKGYRVEADEHSCMLDFYDGVNIALDWKSLATKGTQELFEEVKDRLITGLYDKIMDTTKCADEQLAQESKKIYVPCFDGGTKAEQLYTVLNEGGANPFVPWDVDVDDNGDTVVVVPISDITLKKTLSLQDMYRAVRDQLVSNAEYIIENMKNTEPVDREEWERLTKQWEDEG